MERGFLTAKERGSGNFVKEKGNVPNSKSFATKVKGNTSQKTVNFWPLFTLACNGVDVHVPKESVSVMNEWLNNTVYGFFFGKRVAYPVVENYVKNTWGKFGIVKSMMIKDIHFFKFGSKERMEAMLESGPWLIHNVSLILKQWTPDANIIKEDVCNIPVLVKFHDVPITAFTEDGLSVIATKLAMIELKVDVELSDTIVVVVLKFSDDCPKKIFSYASKHFKMPRQPARGPLVGLKPKSTFVYPPVFTKKAAKANGNPKVQTANKATTPALNLFDALSTLVDEEEGGAWKTARNGGNEEASASKPNTSMGDQFVESDEDEVEYPDDETSRYMSSTVGGGFREDDLDFDDRYEARVYDLLEQMQTFCDQFDIRLYQCPLIRYLSPRDVSHEGFSLLDKVSDMVSNEGWKWPQSWLLKRLPLTCGQLRQPLLETNMEDTIWWRDGNGVLSKFSVKAAWEAFRARGTITTWHRIVWFSQNIPRHAFLLWLIMHNSLETQEKLRQWDVGIGSDLSQVTCVFCSSQPDSHAHLFFECQFSAQVWTSIRHLAGMDAVPARLEDVVSFLQPIADQRTVISIIGRLILAAIAYYIWDERNKRVFKQVKRSWADIRDIIITTVRLKLFTLKFKNNERVIKLLAEWKMPKNFRLCGD
ncbi:reverse transcriptase domain, reverse transcriptase zinc-binding domain protein [Tanacetum coccineum]